MLAETLRQLQWDASRGGKPWAETLPPVPDDPFAQAERVIRAVTEVGRVLERLHQVGYVCTGFAPEILVRTETGVRIKDVQACISRAGKRSPSPAIAPSFSAPEVVEQAAECIGTATDVFHLGALFYAIAARKWPEGTSQEGLKSCNYRLPRFRVYDPTFPVGFAHVWQKAMQAEPSRRYPSAAQFIDALNLALESARCRSRGEKRLRFDVGARTEIGKVKGQLCPENQDGIFPDPAKGERSQLPESGHGVLAIADGVTNCDYGSGTLASEIVIRRVKRAASRFADTAGQVSDSWEMEKLFAVLRQGVVEATEEISRNVPSGPDVDPNRLMSSTLVAAAVQGHQVLVGSTGNSKAFLVTPDFVEQINLDDDIWHARLRSGMSPEQVERQKGNRALRRVVGACALQDGKIVPDMQRIRFSGTRAYLAAGDVLLLCSDGLIERGAYLDAGDAWRIIQENLERPAQEICDILISAANDRQKPPSLGDNISAIVVKALPA
jgi:serine/threonine protein phosphatase PrpC